MYFSQTNYEITCEWGPEGLEALLPSCDAAIIVDVLSFSTCVDIAAGRQAIVFPYRYKDESANAYADSNGAILAAARDSKTGYSLSPQSLMTIPAKTRLVLPSPNGARLSLMTKNTPTFAGCLRNAKAVAQIVQTIGKRICVIPAGEQWDSGCLRVAAEDFVRAGAIVHYLHGQKSPEAELATACFECFKPNLLEYLSNCSSGKELSQRGFQSDIALAGALNESSCVPILKEGAYMNYVAG